MANSTFLKLACALVLCMVVVAPHAEAAINCGMVTSKLASCIGYLKGGPGPSPACCSGISALKSAAASTADKQTACGCLKTAATSIKGLNYGMAAGLPGKCGINIPYKISPSTDCSKVQ